MSLRQVMQQYNIHLQKATFTIPFPVPPYHVAIEVGQFSATVNLIVRPSSSLCKIYVGVQLPEGTDPQFRRVAQVNLYRAGSDYSFVGPLFDFNPHGVTDPRRSAHILEVPPGTYFMQIERRTDVPPLNLFALATAPAELSAEAARLLIALRFWHMSNDESSVLLEARMLWNLNPTHEGIRAVADLTESGYLAQQLNDYVLTERFLQVFQTPDAES